MEEDYREGLSIIDGLYTYITVDAKKYICRSKKTSIGMWKIACTDATDKFWETDLEYDEVLKHVSVF